MKIFFLKMLTIRYRRCILDDQKILIHSFFSFHIEQVHNPSHTCSNCIGSRSLCIHASRESKYGTHHIRFEYSIDHPNS